MPKTCTKGLKTFFISCTKTQLFSNPELYLAQTISQRKLMPDLTTAGERVLKIDGSAQGFATVAEPFEIKAGVNTLPREIFLPAVDLNTFGVQVSQTQDVILTNASFPGVEVKIFAGSVFNPDGTPYTGKLMVLQVPSDKTPLSLPENALPDIVAAVQPGGLTLNPPAQLTMPNTAEYPEGASLKMFSLNPNTGVFENVGTGQVQGNKIVTSQGGMGFTAWHWFRALVATIADIFDPANRNPNAGCQLIGSSASNATNGDLREDHVLPSVKFLDKTFTTSLVYHSNTAFPRINFQFDIDYSQTIKPSFTQDKINFAGIEVDGPFRNTKDGIGNEFRMGHIIDVSQISSRIVNVNYGIRASYGPETRLLSTVTSSNDLFTVINNQTKSPFGAGWALDINVPGGFSKVFPQPLGDLLLLEGDGSAKRFTPLQAAGLLCIGNQLWEVVTSTKTVRVYDATTLEKIHETIISPSTVGRPFGFTHDPVQKKMYFAIFPGGGFHIEEMDMEDFSVRVGPVLALGGGINTPTIDARKSLVLTANRELIFPLSGRLMRFSADTLEFIATQNVAKATRDSHLKISEDGSTLWMVSFVGGGPNVVEIDLDTFAVLRERVFTGSTAFSLTVHEGREELYVTVNETAQLSIYQLDLKPNLTDPALFAIKRQINFNSNFTTNSLGPTVSLGVGSHIYINLRDLNTPDTLGTVLKLADADNGSILNPSLATDLNFIESIPGDPRVFAVGPSGASGAKIVIIDGETGLLLQESEAQFRGGSLLKPESRNQTMFFESPAGDFSTLSFNNNNTESDLTDDFYLRTMNDGTEHKYNRSGLLQEIKDNNGNTFSFSYIDANNDGKVEELEKITTPVNTEYVFAYTNGKIVSITDPANRITSFTHDANGNLTSITNPDNTTRQFSYDQNHLLTSQTNERNLTSTYAYDNFGAIVKTILPDNSEQSFVVERCLGLVDTSSGSGSIDNPAPVIKAEDVEGQHKSPLNHITKFKTDALGGLLKITDSEGRTSTFERDANSMATKVTDAKGTIFNFSYDNKGNITSSSQPTMAVGSTIEYDAKFNKPTKITDALNNVGQYVYDTKGNWQKTITPLNEETTIERDSKGLITKITDAKGNITTLSYNTKGLLVSLVDALNNTTTFTYDLAGNMLTLTDALNNITTFTYNPMNRILTRTDPLSGVITVTYDPRGNVLTTTDANNNTTTFTYDLLDRVLTSTDAENNTTSVAYDSSGNIISHTDALGRVTYRKYDGLGRLTKVIQKISDTIDIIDADDVVTSIAYDQIGNISSITDAKGRVTFRQYNILNQLVRTIRKVGDSSPTPDADDIVTEFFYDKIGNIVSIKDPLGRVTFNKFDANNKLTQVISKVGDTLDIIDSDDIVNTVSFDQNGNRTKIVDAEGKVIYLKYDPLDRVTKIVRKVGDTADVIDAADAVTTFVYNEINDRTAIIDANGNKTLLKYDANHRLIQSIRKIGDTSDIVDADDIVSNISYDAVGNILTQIDPNGITSTRTYDKINRLLSFVNGANEATSFSYDKVGNITTVNKPNGNVISSSFDELNRLIFQQDSLGAITTVVYDKVGNIISQSDANGNTISTKVDDLNRPIEITDPLGEKTLFSYDKIGNNLSVADRNTRITTQVFDDLNRKTSVTNALGHTNTFGYNKVGNLTSFTDANNNTTTFTYSDLHELTKKTLADGKEISYTHDKMGNLTSQTDQKNTTISFEYDERYLLTKRNLPNSPDDTFAYDKGGRMLSATKAGWQVSFSYDNADRITQTTQKGVAINFTYDIANRRNTIIYPGGQSIAELTDKRERLIQITNGASILAQYSYDLANRMLTRSYSNGVNTALSYDKNDRVTRIETKDSSSNLLVGFAHTFDKEGNRLSTEKLHQLTQSETYNYDNVDRLVDFKSGQLVGNTIASPNKQISYNLDPVGNMQGITEDGSTETRTHNNVNELTSRDGQTLQYDANGNLIDDGQRIYTYDDENQLTKVTRKSDNQILVEYQYDALSRRVVKKSHLPTLTETRFLYDINGFTILGELNTSNALQRSYIWGVDFGGSIGGLISTINHTNSKTTFPLYDNIGNITHLTNASGAVSASFRYSPFGKLISSSGVDVNEASFRFSTKYFDSEVGLYYYGFRYYSPELKRWINRDPLEELGGSNLYAFVGNNPLGNIDPDGRLLNPLTNFIAAVGTLIEGVVTKKVFGQNFAVLPAFQRNRTYTCLFGPAGFLVKYIGGTTLDTIDLIRKGVPPAQAAFFASVGNFLGDVGAGTLAKVVGSSTVKNAAASTARAARNLIPDAVGSAIARGGSRIKGGVAKGVNAVRTGTQKLKAAANKLATKGCFVAGTLVLTANGHIPIEKLKVGDRVLTAQKGKKQQNNTKVDKKTWRKIKLVLTDKDDGSKVEIEMLRPIKWIKNNNCKVGEKIWLIISEMGTEGWAKVLAIGQCPQIRAGPGRVILSTFKRASDKVLDITCHELDKSIGITSNHLIFSQDKNKWVPAGSLQIGEKLQTYSGSVCVASISKRNRKYQVYNVEVEKQHWYFVSTKNVLSHNDCPKKNVFRGTNRTQELAIFRLTRESNLKNIKVGEKTLGEQGFKQGKTGIVLSDTGIDTFTEVTKNLTRADTKTIAKALNEAIDANSKQLQKQIKQAGSLKKLLVAQALKGTEFAREFGAKALISVSKAIEVSRDVFKGAGGALLRGKIPKRNLKSQVLDTSTEAELFIKKGFGIFEEIE